MTGSILENKITIYTMWKEIYQILLALIKKIEGILNSVRGTVAAQLRSGCLSEAEI